MFTCKDIYKIINSPEKENLTIELKSFRKLFDDDHKDGSVKRKEIAYTIVALANRFGGKLIFGINDDGSFDGKNKIDIDKAKESINQICTGNISPIVEYQSQFLECPEGDLLIIHIPKRKGIPFAYINSKNSIGEITNRVYYIKTYHGKQLVSDSQLAWLFNNTDDPKFDYKFRIAIEFNKNLELLNFISDQCSREVCWFMPYILKRDNTRLKTDSTYFSVFFIQLFPYFVLKSFSVFFSHSWYIHISKGFDRMSSGPIISNFISNPCPVRIENIPVTGVSVLNDYFGDFKQILTE